MCIAADNQFVFVFGISLLCCMRMVMGEPCLKMLGQPFSTFLPKWTPKNIFQVLRNLY